MVNNNNNKTLLVIYVDAKYANKTCWVIYFFLMEVKLQ